MRRPISLTYVVGLASVVLVTGLDAVQAAGRAKPNIVVFLSDDVGYGEYGFQGNRDIPTPNIDSLATNGVRFTNGYVSGPYCSPTRAGLMTGRYQTRFGHEWNEGPSATGAAKETFGLPLTETTLADRLKKLGYATCAIGKWHLGYAPQFRPMRRGFDEFYGTLANTPFYHPNLLDSRVSPEPAKVEDENFYTTDAYADRAVDWIEKHKNEPFFIYFPFNAQHAPLQAPAKYLDRFKNIHDKQRQLFAAMMSSMDDAVGRVLNKIRDIGHEENTLYFFLADNGGPTLQTTSKNGPLRGFKATTSEGGVRVPFVAQWKGKYPAGVVYEHPIIQLDIHPTAVAAAGAAVDSTWKLDGVNLTPYLLGENKDKPHETLYWRFGQQMAIRDGDWKLVASRIDMNVPRLINLKDDISEASDLMATAPEKAKALKEKWDRWNAEQKDPLWVPQPAAKAQKANKANKAGKKAKKTEAN